MSHGILSYDDETHLSEPVLDDMGSFLFEPSENSDDLIIFFGGVAGRIGMRIPPFEFVKSTKYFDYNKLFVRDVYQSWYHRGLYKYTNSINETLSLLIDWVGKGGYQKIVCMGNSAGGFAAIFFGVKIGVDIIHAFSPQTFLDLKNKIRYFDYRWNNLLFPIYRLKTQKVLSLKNHVSDDTESKIFIHYCVNQRLDRIHAEYLKARNIMHYPYPCKGHNVVTHIRDAGLLERVVGITCFKKYSLLYNKIIHNIQQNAEVKAGTR